MAEAIKGIEEANVTPWLEANVEGLVGPVVYDLIAGGHSNLTYKVNDARGRAFVLRRPPLGQVLATAHDMGREHRIISALGPTDVPVPPALAYCDDTDVNGAPFYVMGFVEGHILRDAAAAEASLTPEQRRRAGESLVDVLAEIHAVDPGAVGLGELGRKEGYIERQLKRWYRQFEQSKLRDVPDVDEVHGLLLRDLPDQGPATIVHGDYRLDNCMLADDGEVSAVLDWEICTLGDPMADVGLLSVYWTDPDDEAAALGASATTLDGFPRRQEMIERYAERSGRDVSQVGYYAAFGYWKLACILDGVYTRYAGGSMGSDTGFEHFDAQVLRLAAEAKRALRGAR
ncbi:MAG: phosphotransferase family protein [Acidimicrobiales bacterium]